MAVEYDGGVIIGADSRTSTGVYVANRVSDKLTEISDTIFCCRSGSSADTQATADLVKYNLNLHRSAGCSLHVGNHMLWCVITLCVYIVHTAYEVNHHIYLTLDTKNGYYVCVHCFFFFLLLWYMAYSAVFHYCLHVRQDFSLLCIN